MLFNYFSLVTAGLLAGVVNDSLIMAEVHSRQQLLRDIAAPGLRWQDVKPRLEAEGYFMTSLLVNSESIQLIDVQRENYCMIYHIVGILESAFPNKDFTLYRRRLMPLTHSEVTVSDDGRGVIESVEYTTTY